MALSLSFFWHMHQPDYRGKEGTMRMPWVFLHAIKDYYDMPWTLSRHPSLKATFNLTPPLMEQLLLYMEKGASADRFLTLWLKEPRELSSEERSFVLRICRSPQRETMVRPLPRFEELFDKKELNDREFVDLEVLFLLSWCGTYLRRHEPTVEELLGKGENFVHADKARLLDALLAFLPSIFRLYAALRDEGRIALSTTPLNHPILPLLLNMENARISNPTTRLPANHFPLEEDAKEQVVRAIALYKKVFGRKPTGFWPAEGAVDAGSVALYRACGLKWIATDEAILFRSLGREERAELYGRHAFDDLFIAFRDHGLSDLIGFTYRYWEGEKAAEDFVGHLAAIRDRYGENAVVSVILDGENAWEFYPQNGFPFFEALYGALEKLSWCQTVTMDELAQGEASPLPRLHPGSWIYGTFDTWVGHPEKNAAWELIYQTKSDYLRHAPDLDETVREAILGHFLAAECSDWFWWYGEDHHTDFAAEFDELFRTRLIAVYELMGLTPPANLYKPIAGDKKDLHALVNEPKFPIQVTVDGKVTSFFEWLGSGMVDETRLFSTMDRVRGPVERLYWGENNNALFLRLDGDTERLAKSVLFIYAKGEGCDVAIEIDMASTPLRGDLEAAIESVVEVGINKRLYFSNAPSVRIRLEIAEEGKVVQVLPGASELVVDLRENYARNWFV